MAHTCIWIGNDERCNTCGAPRPSIYVTREEMHDEIATLHARLLVLEGKSERPCDGIALGLSVADKMIASDLYRLLKSMHMHALNLNDAQRGILYRAFEFLNRVSN